MSFKPDDYPTDPPPARSSHQETLRFGAVPEDEMLYRYVLDSERPEETDGGMSPLHARALRRLRDWAERDTDAVVPSSSYAFDELWERIRKLDAPSTTKAGQDSQRISVPGRHDKTVKHIGRIGGVFSKHTLPLDQHPQTSRMPHDRAMVSAQRPRQQGVWHVMAGAILGVLGIAIGWHSGTRQLVWRTPRSVSTYTTTNGERANLALLDGTTVALGPASRLDVPADFAAGNHTVTLTGEALFTVAHHDGTSFAVTAGRTTTRVLGTSFVVRHYPTDRVTTVAVRDGKVSVGSTVVMAQRLIKVGNDGVVHPGLTDASVFSFTTGMLVLNDMSLSDAIPELERWYDAEIRLGDPALGRLRIEGQSASGSLTDLTYLLEMAFDVRVVRQGRVLTIYPRR